MAVELNRYDDMSALNALKLANEGKLLLPDIQREYVWNTPDIEKLFESIIDGYPIGACIFWKTNRTIINNQKPNLYYFLRDFEEEKSRNIKTPEVLKEESDYYIVLDGQQRITSLNIALYGSYTQFKGGKGIRKDNPKNWIRKELYYNLDFYDVKSDGEDGDEEYNPSKRFCFLTEVDAAKGNYYKIKQLLAYDEIGTLCEDLIDLSLPKKAYRDLTRLFDSLQKGLIHYCCITEENYDNALDVFVRVNSTGRKLTKSDLLFSTLIDGWIDGKACIETALDIMNSKGDGFKFSKEYLMRLCLILVGADANLKINALTSATLNDIRSNWSKISKAVDDMTSLLADIGLCDETISSYNATMPLAYYFFKGGRIKSKEDEQEARKFLSVSMAKRLFGVASNTALTSTRNALKNIDCSKTRFSLELFSSVGLIAGRTFRVEEKDIDIWLDTYEKGQDTYILLSLLYPNLKLSQVSFHQDHCHPFASFEKRNLIALNIDSETISRWQNMRNLLPNLQFLEGKENESKNKTPLKDWVAAGNKIEYYPINHSLELKDFEDFYATRRELMKTELMKIFGI